MNEKEKMRFCAFADEASTSLSRQIESLGRNSIDFGNPWSLREEYFRKFYERGERRQKKPF